MSRPNLHINTSDHPHTYKRTAGKQGDAETSVQPAETRRGTPSALSAPSRGSALTSSGPSGSRPLGSDSRSNALAFLPLTDLPPPIAEKKLPNKVESHEPDLNTKNAGKEKGDNNDGGGGGDDPAPSSGRSNSPTQLLFSSSSLP